MTLMFSTIIVTVVDILVLEKPGISQSRPTLCIFFKQGAVRQWNEQIFEVLTYSMYTLSLYTGYITKLSKEV